MTNIIKCKIQKDDSYCAEINGVNHFIQSSDSEALKRFGITEWIDEGNTPEPYVEPEPSWIDKRLANIENGGYGTTGEQFEMIGEQGMEVYQAHIAKVKSDIPKEI